MPALSASAEDERLEHRLTAILYHVSSCINQSKGEQLANSTRLAPHPLSPSHDLCPHSSPHHPVELLQTIRDSCLSLLPLNRSRSVDNKLNPTHCDFRFRNPLMSVSLQAFPVVPQLSELGLL